MTWQSFQARSNLWLGNLIRWRRGNYREQPAGALSGLSDEQQTRINTLNSTYHAHFENRFNQKNSLENYLYLDMLHHLRATAGDNWPMHREVVDIGSKNFYYAAVLNAVLEPSRLEGIEIEGYRLYGNFYSRYDYAMAYIRELPNTQFTVADFRHWQHPTEVLCCLYPFIFKDTHTNWQLPASVFDPDAYFDAVVRNLKTGGVLIMINQGIDEAEQAHRHCEQRGLHKVCELIETSPLIPRDPLPISSLWKK